MWRVQGFWPACSPEGLLYEWKFPFGSSIKSFTPRHCGYEFEPENRQEDGNVLKKKLYFLSIVKNVLPYFLLPVFYLKIPQFSHQDYCNSTAKYGRSLNGVPLRP